VSSRPDLLFRPKGYFPVVSVAPDYRIPFVSVLGASQEDLFERVIENAWPDLAEPDTMKRLGYATPGQRALLAITLFMREVDNGGLQQFFGKLNRRNL